MPLRECRYRLRARPPFFAAFFLPARAFICVFFVFALGRVYALAMALERARAFGRARFFGALRFVAGRGRRAAGADGRRSGSSEGIASVGSISGGTGDGISIASSVINGSPLRAIPCTARTDCASGKAHDSTRRPEASA